MLLLLSSAFFTQLVVTLAFAAPTHDTVPLANITTQSASAHLAFTSASCRDIDDCRTLWNIIWSCIATMFICIWVAIHRDVPSPKESWLQGQMNEIVIPVIMTFLAPEATLAWAVDQFLDARKLYKELEQARLDREKRWVASVGRPSNTSEDTLVSRTRRRAISVEASQGEDEDLVDSKPNSEWLVLTTTGNAWKLTEDMELPHRRA